MDETWQALSREAGLAAEHIAIGATAIGKTNYAQPAYYGQAFFALTVGFERATKLALVVDHALEHSGAFPQHSTLRKHGHNLEKLLEQTDEIGKRRGLAAEERLPQTAIHEGIVRVLSDFASNVTRYYNLDLVTGDPRTAGRDDPIGAWYGLVITPILAAHYDQRHRDRHQRNAQQISELLSGHTSVLYHSERGDEIDTVFEASIQAGINEFARPYARMYVLQIARFLARLHSELGYTAYGAQVETVPHLSEFFGIFENSDSYFRNKEAWSIYQH